MTPDRTDAGPERLPFDLCVVGVNHQTAPLRVRESLSYTESAAIHLLRLALEGAADPRGLRVREAAVLSTCNRTEAYLILAPSGAEGSLSAFFKGTGSESGIGAVAASGIASAGAGSGDSAGASDTIERRLSRLLCGEHGEIAREHPQSFYHLWGREAADHLFRVASGLDSMVQGEAQILGQVRRAHQIARQAKGIGPILDRLFSSAFHAGKRSRSESAIGRGAVSIASVAVELAVKVVGPLGRRSALVIGAGDTGRLAAQHLSSEQPHRLWIANRTLERAQALADEVGGVALPLTDAPAVMAEADVVVVAVSSPDPLITGALARAALRRKRHSTVFMDISVPRSIEPSVRELDGAFVYDLDALEKVIKENQARRSEEVPRVELILEEELGQYSRWVASLGAGPLITQIRQRFEKVREEEVRRYARNAGSEELQRIERITKGILNKLLHGPTVHLRNGGAADPDSLELLRRIFQLDSDAEVPPEIDEKDQS